MDYGKYCFEISKKEKEARKNQRIAEVKEIRLSVNIGSHDFDTKLSHAMKFLKGGHRIKIIVKFKGREMVHVDLGEKLINRFIESCNSITYNCCITISKCKFSTWIINWCCNIKFFFLHKILL